MAIITCLNFLITIRVGRVYSFQEIHKRGERGDFSLNVDLVFVHNLSFICVCILKVIKGGRGWGGCICL